MSRADDARRMWAELIAKGRVVCLGCMSTIRPGESWDIVPRPTRHARPRHTAPCPTPEDPT